jgi:large subunit ribosomal protein L4
MNKKEKRIALKSALTDSVQNDRVIVLDELKLNEIKTKEMIRILGNIKAADKALIVTAEKDDIVVKSARNLAKVVTTEASILNVYDIMNAKTVVLTKDAVAKIEEVYA